jgi:anti-sigma B factor antagonist
VPARNQSIPLPRSMMQGYATIRQTGKVAIVDLSGIITAADGTMLLRNRIKELMAAGQKNVLVNLRDLKYLDSAGMGELVGVCTSLRTQGGDLKLVNPPERIMNLLRLTKLSTIFAIFDDEAGALQSF